MEIPSRRIVVTLVVVVLLCIAIAPMNVHAQTGLEPKKMSISGAIVDNYANITYEMNFDNTESSSSQEVNWFFGLQSGIRLSNVSVLMGEEIYWGKVIPEDAAIATYEENVEEGKTAVLVTRVVGGYELRLNVANFTEAILTVYVEGLLVRHLGLYELEFPIGGGSEIVCEFEIDLLIISHYGNIEGYGVTGLSSFTTTDLSDGIRIQYSVTSLLVPELLTVSYFLNRQVGGSQLLTYNNGTQNFFAYLLAPSISSEEDQAPREYVFVIDRSGSMSGTKMSQAKSAFSSMIEGLSANDIFNIVSFSTQVDILWGEPYAATSKNINTAQNYVNELTADGSTNFYGAGLTALDTFTEGDYAKVLLFLSDGLPTAGEITDATGILNGLRNKNELIVSISTVAFGSDADESLMANLASQNNGFFVQIDINEEASTALLDFYQVWAIPVANGFSISVTGALDFFSLQPLGNAPFFNGSEVVICGRYETGITIDTTVSYDSGAENYVNTALAGNSDYHHVELIWAQYKISWLLKQVSLEGETPQLREDITSLAMQYGLVVDGYTGMILVAEEESETVTEAEASTSATTYYDALPAIPTVTGGYYATQPDAAAFGISPLWIGLMGGVYVGGAVLVVLFIIRKVKQKRLG